MALFEIKNDKLLSDSLPDGEFTAEVKKNHTVQNNNLPTAGVYLTVGILVQLYLQSYQYYTIKKTVNPSPFFIRN